jgi:hypothetical protein
MDVTALGPLIRDLAMLLRENNFEATDRFASLGAALGDGEWSPLLARLEARMDVLDFPGALAALEALAEALAIPLSREGER